MGPFPLFNLPLFNLPVAHNRVESSPNEAGVRIFSDDNDRRHITKTKEKIANRFLQEPILHDETAYAKGLSGWRYGKQSSAIFDEREKDTLQNTQNLLERLQDPKNRSWVAWLAQQKNFLDCFSNGILDSSLEKASFQTGLHALQYHLSKDTILTQKQKNEIYFNFTRCFDQLVLDGRLQRNEKLIDKVILLQTFIARKADKGIVNEASQRGEVQALYGDDGKLNEQALGAVMFGVSQALRSERVSKMDVSHQVDEFGLHQNDRHKLAKMADDAERLGHKIAQGRCNSSPYSKRYNLDADGLYGPLRSLAKDWTAIGGTCKGIAKDRALQMAGVLEMLAQQHNTALILARYDDAGRKLQEAHGTHFAGARIPGQGASHGSQFDFSLGFGVGVAPGGNGFAAKLSAGFGYGEAMIFNVDYDGSPERVDRRTLSLSMKAAGGAELVNADLANLEGELKAMESYALFTQHANFNDLFKATISDTRETYIHEGPLLYFGDKPEAAGESLAKEEIKAVNRVTSFAPLNVIRNLGENMRSEWNSSQRGIAHGARPFNELTFLKAQGGVGLASLSRIFEGDDDPALAGLKNQLDQQQRVLKSAESNRAHHLLTGSITTYTGQISGSTRLGWSDKQVNSDKDHPVGMGVYGKASGLIAQSNYKVAFFLAPHEIIKKFGGHYPEGEKAALKDFIENKYTQFNPYVEEVKKSNASEQKLEKLNQDLVAFREEGARMQGAKALLINRQVRDNPKLEAYAWKEFSEAYKNLRERFHLVDTHSLELAPSNHDERIKLVTRANDRLGCAWTALSLGVAQAQCTVPSEALEKLANEVKQVDVASVHPLIVYGHSPIRLRTDAYKSVEIAGRAGVSLGIKLPDVLAAAGPGLLGSGLTGISIGAEVGLSTLDKSGHPNPVRNGTFRTLTLNLKLQIPTLPGLPHPAALALIAKNAAEQIVERIADEPGFRELDEAGRQRIKQDVHHDFEAQLCSMRTDRRQLPSNLTYTYESQWHRMKGADEFSHAYDQSRVTIEANHTMNVPISHYVGVGGEVQVGIADKNSTTLALVPKLGGAVYSHLLQYHDDGILKPSVIAGDPPRMNWEGITDSRDHLMNMYFSRNAIVDFLDECATLGPLGVGIQQPPRAANNTARILVDITGRDSAAARRGPPALDTEDIKVVRAATRDMSSLDRMRYFEENQEARALFNQYLAQVEFLLACNNHGKTNPRGEGWKLTPTVAVQG